MRPVICMITDGRTGGAAAAAAAEAVVESVAAAARGGVDLIQVRERTLEDGALVTLVGRCVEAVRGTRTRVLVNDRPDVAVAARAHGVHLRGDSYDAARVRAIVPPAFLIGRSVHTAEDAVRAGQAGTVDYLMFGSVFETASKPGRTPAGLAALERTVRDVAIPVLAVGGVTEANAALVAQTGAAGVAAIGVFAGARTSLASRIELIARAFDTPKHGS
jgi:thiamine-phosphate pyrophosphorylase